MLYYRFDAVAIDFDSQKDLEKHCQTVGTAPYQKPLKGISGSTSTTKNKKGLNFQSLYF